MTSIADPVTHAKASPKTANYAASATAFQLASELLKDRTGIRQSTFPTWAVPNRCCLWPRTNDATTLPRYFARSSINSYHMALSTAKVAASGNPRIHAKYHIVILPINSIQ